MRTRFNFMGLCVFLCSIFIFISCEKEDGNDENTGNNNNQGNFTIDKFDLSDAKYLMIHGDMSKSHSPERSLSTRAWYYEDDDKGNPVNDWTDDPLLVKIDINGKATPVMAFSLGGNEVKWAPKSINYLNSNYVLFETDYDYTDRRGNIQQNYLVRLSDGKAFEFEYFHGYEYNLEDSYLYGRFDFKIKNEENFYGTGRFYLPQEGNIRFEALPSYYEYGIDLFTKNYFGNEYGRLITHKSSNRSYVLIDEPIGVDYYCDYFYHRKDNNLIQTFFSEEELISSKVIPVNEYCNKVFAYNGTIYVFFYNHEKSKYDLKHYYGNELQDIKNWEGFNERTYDFSKVSYITNDEDRIECHLTDYDNNIYVIDFSNPSENIVYTLFDAQKYSYTYKIDRVTYLEKGNRYSIEATKLSNTKRILLSLEVNPNSNLIEEEEYDSKVITIIPMN